MDRFIKANAELSKFSRNYIELKKGLPIRPSEMGVLNIITQTPGPHTSVKLADLLGVSKPMITAHLTSLAGKGYITKEQSPDDKRTYYVIPTEKALTLVESAKQDMEKQFKKLIDAMGQAAFDQLVDLAQEANQIIEANKGGIGNGSER